jgi:hypothetical protein
MRPRVLFDISGSRHTRCLRLIQCLESFSTKLASSKVKFITYALITAMVKQFSTCRWASAICPAYTHFAIQKQPYERDCCIQQCKNMNITCHSYGKVFNNLSEGVQYSSTTGGFLAFCLDECCKDYLVSAIN